MFCLVVRDAIALPHRAPTLLPGASRLHPSHEDSVNASSTSVIATALQAPPCTLAADLLESRHSTAPGFLPSADSTEFPMALKKSELYSSLWQSCDELRGGMDATDMDATLSALE